MARVREAGAVAYWQHPPEGASTSASGVRDKVTSHDPSGGRSVAPQEGE